MKKRIFLLPLWLVSLVGILLILGIIWRVGIGSISAENGSPNHDNYVGKFENFTIN